MGLIREMRWSFSLSQNCLTKKMLNKYGGFVVIDSDKFNVQEGNFYSTVGHLFPGVAAEAAVNVLIMTGKYHLHATLEITAGGDAYFSLERNPSITSNGTAIALINHNDNSANAAKTNIYHSAVVGSPGALIVDQEFLPGGIGKKSKGNDNLPSNLRVLSANTNYLITVTNKSTAAENIDIRVVGAEMV